jgi:hypothetical protein
VKTRTNVTRRTIVVVDRPVEYEFCGRHVISAGTEFVLGEDEGRVILADRGDVLFRLAPEFSVRIDLESYHLEEEIATQTIQTVVQRRLVRPF